MPHHLPPALDLSYNVYKDILLTDQVSRIVSAEKARLDTKTTDINEWQQSQNRKDFFQRMSTKRNFAYWKMFAVIMSIIAVVLLLLWMKNLYFVPGWIITISIALVLTAGITYFLFIWWDFMQRDKINFDEVYSTSPAEERDKQQQKLDQLTTDGAITSAMLLGFGNNCKEQACCAAGTVFLQNKCVAVAEGFGTGSQTVLFTNYS